MNSKQANQQYCENKQKNRQTDRGLNNLTNEFIDCVSDWLTDNYNTSKQRKHGNRPKMWPTSMNDWLTDWTACDGKRASREGGTDKWKTSRRINKHVDTE